MIVRFLYRQALRKINLLLLRTVNGRVFEGFRLWRTIPDDKSAKLGQGSEFEVA